MRNLAYNHLGAEGTTILAGILHMYAPGLRNLQTLGVSLRFGVEVPYTFRHTHTKPLFRLRPTE